MYTINFSIHGENRVSGCVEGAERNFFATTGNDFCKSYKIILAMFKLISSLFLMFPYHQALKFTEIFFLLEIFFAGKNLKEERQVLANTLWRELSTLFGCLSIC